MSVRGTTGPFDVLFISSRPRGISIACDIVCVCYLIEAHTHSHAVKVKVVFVYIPSAAE